jgi:hypothetical protein
MVEGSSSDDDEAFGNLRCLFDEVPLVDKHDQEFKLEVGSWNKT